MNDEQLKTLGQIFWDLIDDPETFAEVGHGGKMTAVIDGRIEVTEFERELLRKAGALECTMKEGYE